MRPGKTTDSGPTFAFPDAGRRPRGRTVVSLTRPSYRGKRKLRPNALWSLAPSSVVRLDLRVLAELGQFLGFAEHLQRRLRLRIDADQVAPRVGDAEHRVIDLE